MATPRNPETVRAYLEHTKEHRKQRAAAYFQRRKDHLQQKSKEWRSENLGAHRAYQAAYARDLRATSPHARANNSLQMRLSQSLRKIANGHIPGTNRPLTGCAWAELKTHVESLFTPEMNWGNYGSFWHIDHIKPRSNFNLAEKAQQEECFHFSNLRPLRKEENYSKGSRTPLKENVPTLDK